MNFMQQMLGVLAGGVVETIVSASVRSVVPYGNSTVSGNTKFRYRSGDTALVAGSAPQIWFWNGYAPGFLGISGAALERGSGNLVVYAAALLKNPSGTAANQTAATAYSHTFAGIRSGNNVYRRDSGTGLFVVATWAEFTGAGGAVSGDDLYVTVPSDYIIGSDGIEAVSLAAGEFYLNQQETNYSGAGVQRLTGDLAINSQCDYRWIVATGAANAVHSTDWTGASQIGGGAAFQPFAVTMRSANHSKSVLLAGDSIHHGENAGASPDSTGVYGCAKRSLVSAGISFVDATVSGSNIKDMYQYKGHGARMFLASLAYAVWHNHGHNDRGISPTWGNGIDDGGEWHIQRWHNLQLRAQLKPGVKKITQSTLCSHTTSSDGYVTQAYATGPATYPTGWQYADMLPWLTRTGAFAGVPYDTAAGDPDDYIDFFTAVGCTAVGKWPVGARADGTHPLASEHLAAVTVLAPQMGGLLT
jgi:hypothetical protein